MPAGRGPSPTYETPEVLTLLSSGRARRDSAHLPDERWTLGIVKGQPQASVGNLAGRDTPLSLSEVGKREPHASCSRYLGQQGGTRPRLSRESRLRDLFNTPPGGADLQPPGKSPDITLHAFVPNALKGAWEEALFSWMFKLAKPRSRAIGPQISHASSPRQTAALGLMDSPLPRAEEGDVCECPATRAVEEPAVR